MHIGGVMIGAGMLLQLEPGDYLRGTRPVSYLIQQVLAVRFEQQSHWVLLDGLERPPGPWRPRRLQVRVVALKRSLGFVG